MRADFKDSHPNMPKKRVGKRGSERPKSQRGATAHKAGHAGWPWLLAGLLIGLFVAFLWYLNQHAPAMPPAATPAAEPTTSKPRTVTTPETSPASTVVPRAEPSQPSRQSDAEAEASAKPQVAITPPAPSTSSATDTARPVDEPAAPDWHFYQLLEDAKVDVPVPHIRAPRAEKAPDPKQRMALQVGSFRNVADAERMKAQLALLGYQATIVMTETESHGIWHRVRLGPYDDPRKLAKDRAALYTRKIETLPITLGP